MEALSHASEDTPKLDCDARPSAVYYGREAQSPRLSMMAFARPIAAGARVEVMDVMGRRRAARALPTGATSWKWDGHGDDGVRVEPGVYLVRVVDGDRLSIARVVRLD